MEWTLQICKQSKLEKFQGSKIFPKFCKIFWKNSKAQKYFQNFVKYFAHRRQEEGGKLTTGDREEVTDIGLGGGWGLAGIRGRDATKYKLEFVDKYF